jgi:Carbohydrate-binding module 48 (Isoamylase N-terminal domain)
MTDESRDNDQFITRVATGLRGAPRADAGFVDRVMATVEDGTPLAQQSWWLRPRTLRYSPVAILAIAAAMAFAAIGVGRLASRPDQQRTAGALAKVDTVYLVRFVVSDDEARAVTLVGAFNDWTRTATPMARNAAGAWTVTLPLRQGRHEYAFILQDANGERWVADPSAILRRRDEFGTESSIVSVGES